MAKRVKKPSRSHEGGKAGKAPQPPAAAEAKTSNGVARPTAVVPRRREGSMPATPAPSPHALMRRFVEDMDRLFDDFRLGASLFGRLELPFAARELAEATWKPAVEVAERGGKLVIRADLPGLSKDDVKVEVREDAVSIRGERRQEREEKRKGFYRSERSYGSFYREVPLPEGTDPDRAEATFRNGVLEVTLPAPPKPAKGRQVPIAEG